MSQYTCESCGGTFEHGWTKAEAEAEAAGLWGDVPPDDRAVICDDCFKAFVPWAEGKGLVRGDVEDAGFCLARFEAGRPYPCSLPKGHEGEHSHPMDPAGR